MIIARSHTDSTSESGLQLRPATYSMMTLWAWLSFSVDRLEEFVDLEKDFEEGIVNSAIFLIAMAMQLTNFAVNYHVSGTHKHPLPIPHGPAPPHTTWACPSPYHVGLSLLIPLGPAPPHTMWACSLLAVCTGPSCTCRANHSWSASLTTNPSSSA